MIAVRVLQRLIAGRDGSAQDWKKVKRRLQHIEKQMKKELNKSQKWYCPESVGARLRSPFFLPNGTCYPKMLPSKQKEKIARKVLVSALLSSFFSRPVHLKSCPSYIISLRSRCPCFVRLLHPALPQGHKELQHTRDVEWMVHQFYAPQCRWRSHR